MQEQMIHEMDPRQKYTQTFHHPVVRKADFDYSAFLTIQTIWNEAIQNSRAYPKKK